MLQTADDAGLWGHVSCRECAYQVFVVCGCLWNSGVLSCLAAVRSAKTSFKADTCLCGFGWRDLRDSRLLVLLLIRGMRTSAARFYCYGPGLQYPDGSRKGLARVAAAIRDCGEYSSMLPDGVAAKIVSHGIGGLAVPLLCRKVCDCQAVRLAFDVWFCRDVGTSVR